MFQDERARRHLIWLIVGLVLTLLLKLVGSDIILPAIEPSMTIRFHYSGFKLIRDIVHSCMYAAAGATGASIGLLHRDYRRYRKEKAIQSASLKQIDRQLQAEQRKYSLATPEGIYNYIEDIIAKFQYGGTGTFTSAFTIKEQLDEMNGYQEKLDKLFAANDITNLGDAKDLLQDIEDAICMASTKRLINYYIVGGEQAFIEHWKQTAHDNRILLDQASGMLSDIVEYINGNKSVDDVTNHIAIFRKTIQNFMKEEKENEEQFQKDFGGGGVLANGD